MKKDNSMIIPEWKIRLIAEHEELEKKVEDLIQFICHSGVFKTLPHGAKFLMEHQLHCMKSYLSILDERIMQLSGMPS